jgi:hypothetical protein
VTLGELVKELNAIMTVHPEAKESAVWAMGLETDTTFRIKYVAFDRRHKPPRIRLED